MMPTERDLTATTSLRTEGPELVVESSTALPLVSVGVSFRSGALLDPPGKEGTARVTGRLMRRSGGGLGAEEIDVLIDSLGASIAISVTHSAFTLSAVVIARNLGPLLELFTDIVARPALHEVERARLQREMESELLDCRDDDRTLVRHAFRRAFFGTHPHGRLASGTVSSVRRIGAEDVTALYRSLVVRSGAVFSFAGDIDRDSAARHAESLARALPEGPAATNLVDEPEPAPGKRLFIVDKPERTQTQILIGTLGTHPHDEDHTALLVANTIFGGTFTARMTHEIRSKRGWSYGAYSSLPYDRCRQPFSLWTFPKSDDAAACIALELDMLRKLREHGVKKSELAWAKRYLTRSHAFAIDTPTKRAGLALDELILGLPPRFHGDYLERVRAVTLDDVNAAIRHRIADENLTVVVVGTEAEVGSALRDAVDGLASAEVIPYDRDD